jgi:hypothetical protein
LSTVEYVLEFSHTEKNTVPKVALLDKIRDILFERPLQIIKKRNNISQNVEMGIYYYCIIVFYIIANIFIER